MGVVVWQNEFPCRGPGWRHFLPLGKFWSLILEALSNSRGQHWGPGQDGPVGLLPDVVYDCVVPKPAFPPLLEIP